jgi:hypothetical protein
VGSVRFRVICEPGAAYREREDDARARSEWAFDFFEGSFSLMAMTSEILSPSVAAFLASQPARSEPGE